MASLRLRFGIALVVVALIFLSGGFFLGQQNRIVQTVTKTETLRLVSTVTATASRVTTSRLGQLLVQWSSSPTVRPVGAGDADAGRIAFTTGPFRPNGTLMRLVVKITPTLETKAYEVNSKEYRWRIISTDGVVIGSGQASIDAWSFRSGPYEREIPFTLSFSGTASYLEFQFQNLWFRNIVREGEICTIEITLYDLGV